MAAEEVNFVQNLSNDSFSDVQLVDFGCIAADTSAERVISIMNLTDKPLTYRISVTYILNNIDHNVFKVSITSSVVMPGENADLRIQFSPNVPGLSFTNYYIIDDTAGTTYRLTVTGKCYGPEVTLSKRRINFKVVKNVSKYSSIKDEITIVNASAVETTYQWILPCAGQGYFQISTGTCGLIRAFECITSSVVFSGRALGVYAAELVCLVLNQEPLYLDVLASVVLPENAHLDLKTHTFEKTGMEISLSMHLMQNSLNRLPYIPHASVHDKYLDFDRGSVTDNTRNIAQALCVTNHENEEGFIQWIPDPDNIFIIDPVDAVIPPNESRQFSVRFRPKLENEVYGYLLCGDYQQKVTKEDKTKMKHCLFRIPCIGNTWCPCTEWTTEWQCPTEVIMPPTVPCRTTFTNFMLSNKFEIPMYFKFEAPQGTNFVVLPMCGIVPSRGWEIITVALEAKAFGDYYENWDLVINKVQKARICFSGNAEVSQVEIMSHGYNPNTHAMFEFPPTITGTTNYCVAYFHNLTRMYIHMRVLSTVEWLGADNCGTIVLSPKEIISYHWWFFPKTPDLVYDTTITCSCVCLINGRPVGEPQELFVHIYGFSEHPNLKIVPKRSNLHDVAVGESAHCTITLMNFGSCYFTSRLYHSITGLGDDYSGDKFEIDSPINSLKPNQFIPITFTVMPDGAGMRQIDIKYTILYRTEYDEIEEIQPIKTTILKLWYDGIYPTIKVKRTISVTSPVIMSDHCVWNLANVEELNKALQDCRPNKPLRSIIYGPDLCLSQTANNVVEYVFVLGCIYDIPVPWSMRREKLCDCEMVEVRTGISTYEMRHTCTHRKLVEVFPLSGVVSKGNPNLLHIVFSYNMEGPNMLCYVLTLPNQRVIYIYFRLNVLPASKCCLHAMRRGLTSDDDEYMVIMDCGTVPINNLDPIIRIVWLYNPTEVFATWRLLPGNNTEPDKVIRCLLFFAEVPPMGRLAIPFAFLPSEMIDYDMVFSCSVGPNLEKIRVKGHGGLPNFTATRLDMPRYVENSIKDAYRQNVVYLSVDHLTVPDMPTHCLWREIVAICNDTDHVMRFIWLPERIANIVNIVMTPCWGVIKPKSTEWITMTVYCLQEPATFTTMVACELLDLTERMRFQQNELLRRRKIEKCQQEFIITEFGKFHPNLNDSPPYVENIEKPQATYIAMTVSISSKGQRDGSTRILLNKQWEHTPPYDLLCEPEAAKHNVREKASRNNIIMPDIIRIIDGILWDALQSKMFRNQIEYYANEDLPTHGQVMRRLESTVRPELSRRVTSGICDAIVNKAVFQVHNLNPTKEMPSVLDAE